MPVFLFSMILMVFPVYLAIPQNTFQLTYGGGGEENANDIKQTYDGGYILTGSTNSAGAGQDDLFLLKTDSTGSVEWAKTYGGPYEDRGNAVIQMSDSGYLAVGYAFVGEYEPLYSYVIRTQKNGDTLWTRYIVPDTSYNGSRAISVAITPGGYLIGSESCCGGGWDMMLTKLDSNGNLLWNKTYGRDGDDELKKFLVTPNSGIVLFGEISGWGMTGMGLIKTNPQGDTLWTRVFSSDSVSTNPIGIDQAPNNEIILSYGGSGGGGLLKVDSLGNIIWSKFYDENNAAIAGNGISLFEGGIMLAGGVDI